MAHGRKTGGRKRGTLNKVTPETRERIQEILYDEMKNISNALECVRESNPSMYLNIMVKLLNYVVPKKKDVTTDGRQIDNSPITGVRIIKEIRTEKE